MAGTTERKEAENKEFAGLTQFRDRLKDARRNFVGRIAEYDDGRPVPVVRKALYGQEGWSTREEILFRPLQEPLPHRPTPVGAAGHCPRAALGHRSEGRSGVVHDAWRGKRAVKQPTPIRIPRTALRR